MSDLTSDDRPARDVAAASPPPPDRPEFPPASLLEGIGGLDFSLERWLDRLEGRR
ncbi:MAG: hypothetical protein ACQEUZ_05635 [Pseudomonadota bacterium]